MIPCRRRSSAKSRKKGKRKAREKKRRKLELLARLVVTQSLVREFLKNGRRSTGCGGGYRKGKQPSTGDISNTWLVKRLKLADTTKRRKQDLMESGSVQSRSPRPAWERRTDTCRLPGEWASAPAGCPLAGLSRDSPASDQRWLSSPCGQLYQ